MFKSIKFYLSWSVLEIESNEGSDDEHQAYAAGFLEGQVTKGKNRIFIIYQSFGILILFNFDKDLISLHLRNTVGDFCQDGSKTCDDLFTFLKTNFQWIKTQVTSNQLDPYWHQVKLSLLQFHGLMNGYTGESYFSEDFDVLDKVFDTKSCTFLNLL
jgi:hypothetical protein